MAAAAAAAGVPVVAVSGRLDADRRRNCAAPGSDGAYALTDIEPDVQRCLAEAGPLLEKLGAQRGWPGTGFPDPSGGMIE